MPGRRTTSVPRFARRSSIKIRISSRGRSGRRALAAVAAAGEGPGQARCLKAQTTHSHPVHLGTQRSNVLQLHRCSTDGAGHSTTYWGLLRQLKQASACLQTKARKTSSLDDSMYPLSPSSRGHRASCQVSGGIRSCDQGSPGVDPQGARGSLGREEMQMARHVLRKSDSRWRIVNRGYAP